MKERLNEEWRQITGYEGLYEVSNYGRVRSLDRLVKCGYSKKRTTKGKILKPRKNNSGYYIVNLYSRKNKKNILIHRLVAFAFPEICGKWFEGAEVNHINEIKTDNRAENIEWCTKNYNQNYGDRNELAVITRTNRGYNNGRKRIVQLDMNGNFINIFKSSREIERILGYSHSSISKFCKGEYKYKAPYGFLWKYLEEYGEEDGFSGDISKSSRTDTQKDVKF